MCFFALLKVTCRLAETKPENIRQLNMSAFAEIQLSIHCLGNWKIGIGRTKILYTDKAV